MSKVPPGHRGLLDAELTETLDALRSELDAEDKAGPNVFVIWEAIGRVAARNQGCLDRGEPTFPMPEWVNDYLLRGSEKIERLWLGIEPDDNRSLSEIGFANIGALRKVPRAEGKNSDGSKAVRSRDARADYVAAALGFVSKGFSAFRRHDRVTRDATYLRIHDNPTLESKALKRVRRSLSNVIKQNEHIDSDEAVRNRLSKARARKRGPLKEASSNLGAK